MPDTSKPVMAPSAPRPQNWRTPPQLYRNFELDARRVFGRGYDVDLACDAGNCLAPARAASGDAFSLPSWGSIGVVWCNPPWNGVAPWVARAALDGARGTFLLPARVDRPWFQVLVRVAWVELFTGRVAFVDPIAPNGKERTTPREGAVLAWFGVGKVGVDSTRFRSHSTGLWV